MNPLLKNFRAEFAERTLRLVWRQWNALGVSGTESAWKGAAIDPDALLVFSLHIARYDARLFQEILDWLRLNGALINIQRLNNMLRKYGFSGSRIIPAVAAFLAEADSSQQLKWKRLAESIDSQKDEPLFFLSNGNPAPLPSERDALFARYNFSAPPVSLRGYSRSFDPALPENRLLTYRSFFGVNSRSELICLLGARHGVTAARAARLTGYSARSIQNVLTEMSASGWVESRKEKRDKTYSLRRSPHLTGLFAAEISESAWVLWPVVFQALESIWQKLFSGELDDLDGLALDSEIFLLWKTCVDILSLDEQKTLPLPAPRKTLHHAAEMFPSELLNAMRQLECE